jgi:hypothetical protein
MGYFRTRWRRDSATFMLNADFQRLHMRVNWRRITAGPLCGGGFHPRVSTLSMLNHLQPKGWTPGLLEIDFSWRIFES